jgi:oligopeptide transport system substrate-binding protein
MQAYTVNASITWKIMPSEAQRLSGVQNGELLVAVGAPAKDAEAARNAGRLHDLPRNGTFAVYMNEKHPPFDDAKVREAFALAIDAQSIVDETLGGGVTVSLRVQYADEGRAAMAQAALKDAGYPNGNGFPEVTYGYLEGDDNRLVAEALALLWKETLGVDVNLKAYKAQNDLGVDGVDALIGVDLLDGYDSALSSLAPFADLAAIEDIFAQALPYGGEVSADALRQMEETLTGGHYLAPVFTYPLHLLYDSNVQGMRAGSFGQIYLENVQRVEE